ncbi:L-aminoadipate-semialdehyde dehydrogenase [Martensiomyces pterosporus]|nr:L-aminoadipate-semialdehyde dehydrogenase [Martensiomyces pterosporus]
MANIADLNDRLARWQERLRSPTELQLPTDYPRPIPLKVVEAVETFELTPQTSLAVLQLSLGAADPTASPFTVLLAAFSVLLHRYTAEEDIVVSSSSESSNPLVLRLDVKPTDSFIDVLRTTQRVSREAAADEVPFSALMSAYVAATASDKAQKTESDADANAAPSLFRVRFFNQADADDSTLRQTTTSATDFTVFVRQKSTASLRQLHPTIELQISYNQFLFTAQRIAHMVSQLQMVLAAAADTLARVQSGHELLSEHQVGNMNIASSLDLQAVPNPRADLNWSEFPGSITSIFARNAQSHPDKRFVVESILRPDAARPGKDTMATRSFTYSQILRAARILSRTLRNGGIQREDVVIVYAYRGVDLVVAILGVLMAGATYSVVDPAYPAARQNIYLSVAKPRGLVVLRHAGELPQEVQDYVANELDVVCTVPALELLDDGELRGESDTSATNAVAAATQAVDSSSDVSEDIVEVGHDSIGTLSFTSGSTGIPKGVRGRHFSLTHFYPWMSAEFGIGADDRFTMLSGIAHDPIQRDVFTPVFFGAELHIPTSEDIGIPGQLAQWMRDHEVSITHLTPAMGQLLSANATSQIPSLKNAFFVGDLLTKRDCHRLQSLADNCRIVNMYGTTETQRAVSYCPIPPHSQNPSFLATAKDVIPAGRGMKDVQLLVVNRHGNGGMCAVGEVGEIYVRSGGLAEGYLRLPEATAEKFVPNWFGAPPQATDADSATPLYHGPRDRMYRTGDLGRYRPDGDVECIGRIDDQVKIRGFRIELGEINNMLSQHPRIRANVTLVRRDKYEEKTLVAYIVPSEEEQRRADDPGRRGLIKDIREYLKQKLPSYAVPAVFVPMKKLPLTPNGKVDKAALPFPDTPMFSSGGAAAGRAELEGMSGTERALGLVWADLLELPAETPLELDANFFDLGGHSILATRMVFRVRKEFAVDAPLGLVFKCPTLRLMAAAVDNLLGELQLGDDVLTKAEEEATQASAAFDYAADLDSLIPLVPSLGTRYMAYPPALVESDGAPTFFLTGATGFLGAFILDELLRRHPRSQVLCLTRARTEEAAMERVKAAAVANLVWQDSWSSRVRAVVGDLAQPRLGLSDEDWTLCAEKVDAIVHNGALVHWVYPYEKLRAPNVLSTLEVLKLAQEHHTKPMTFVSSTSALDTEHYVELGASRRNGVRESDDLEGSRYGLSTGYGQSKWVSEKLLMHAREQGFPVTIVRPGYVLGHSYTGATNTDDFIWRLVKGCVELGESPVMSNVVNLCSVDYVAHVVVEAISQPRALSHVVYHVYNREHFRFQDLFDLLRQYGYKVRDVEYMQWRSYLMEFTLSSDDTALFPLLHYVLDDLPTSTKSAELDDTHTQALLEGTGIKCAEMKSLMGLYLAYLVKAGFLGQPAGDAECQLPELDVEIRGLVSRSSHN